MLMRRLITCYLMMTATSLSAGFAANPSAPIVSADAPRAIPGALAAEFFRGLRALCGRRFNGRITEDRPPPAADDPFSNRLLEMHVRDCSDSEIRIPFTVGTDRSRTWIISRLDGGLRLKHDHRHPDGSPDKITMYGGSTVDEGTAFRQSFPADAETLTLFQMNKMPASLPNVWSLELVPGKYFVYELARPTGRLFRVQFDLDR